MIMNIKELDCSEFIHETLYPKKIPEHRCENCKYRKLYSSIWKIKFGRDDIVQENTYICTYYDDFYRQNPVFDTDTCEHWEKKKEDTEIE